MTTSLYEELGVAREATPDQIKRAYRSRAKRSHPDGGGDTETFVKLRRAVAVLSDPDRRKRYDDTGATDEPVNDAGARAMSILAEVLSAVVDQTDDAARCDVVEIISDLLKQKRGQLDEAVGVFDRKIWNLTRVRDRTVAKGKDKRFMSVMGGVLGKLERARELAVGERDSTKLAIKMLESYEFNVDISFEHPFLARTIFTTT